MGVVLAEQVYAEIKAKCREPEKLTVFSEVEQFAPYAQLAIPILRFVLDRPAMAVADYTDKEKILGFVSKELAEAEDEQNEVIGKPERVYELGKELGDVMFFALLFAMFHWSSASEGQKKALFASVGQVEVLAEHYAVDLTLATWYSAAVKDPRNYPDGLYQIQPGETVEQVKRKVENVVPKVKGVIREHLNGRFASVDAAFIYNALAMHVAELEPSERAADSAAELFVTAGLYLWD